MEAYKNLSDVISCDLENYNLAKDVVLEEIKVRKKSWDLIANGSLDLEKVENKSEIAVMYKSLFEKLLEDSHSDFDKALFAIRSAYNVAQEERKQKIDNTFKLFQLSALMAEVEHDSANLLNNIAASMSSLLKDKTLSDDNVRKIKTIKEKSLIGIESLRVYVQKILNTKSESGENFKLNEILPPILEWIAGEYKNKNIELIIPLQDEIPNVLTRVDDIIMRMLLLNIINNAYEAVDLSKRHSFVRIDIFQNNDYVLIRITDNGVGIENYNIGKISNIGVTTKKNNLGLGMPTVRYLIESLGGKIDIYSEVDEGTDVTLFFPIS